MGDASAARTLENPMIVQPSGDLELTLPAHGTHAAAASSAVEQATYAAGATEGTDTCVTAGASGGPGARQSIEAVGVDGTGLQRCLRTAVEARRQGDAQSPSSVGVLLGLSLHPPRQQGYRSQLQGERRCRPIRLGT
jgi:hypothetical protein